MHAISLHDGTTKKFDGEGQDQAPRFFLDVTDLVAFASSNTTPTGIQRVQIELLRAFASIPQTTVFSLGDSRWADLTAFVQDHCSSSPDLFLQSLNAHFGKAKSKATKGRLLRHFGRFWFRLFPPAVRPCDVVFVPGCFWANRALVTFLKHSARHGARVVLTVYDLVAVDHPQWAVPDLPPRFVDALQRIFRHPVEAICISAFTASRLQDVIAGRPGLVSPRASIVPLAHEFPGAARNQGAGRPPPTARLLGLDDDFVLCVGTIEPRKNHQALVHTWREAASSRGWPRLVVAGKIGWNVDAFAADLRQEQGGAGVTFLEAPSEAELLWLYAACSATIYPSLYEGWGLPVGESLWFGKPALCANDSALPEVGGSLCAYFDPLRPGALTAALDKFLNYEALQERRLAIRAAPLRLWSDVSRDLRDVLERTGTAT